MVTLVKNGDALRIQRNNIHLKRNHPLHLFGVRRIPRKPRYLLWSKEACYHIFNRGHNREVVFRQDDDRCFFLELWQRYRDRFALRMYHYCLMDNHFHVSGPALPTVTCFTLSPVFRF